MFWQLVETYMSKSFNFRIFFPPSLSTLVPFFHKNILYDSCAGILSKNKITLTLPMGFFFHFFKLKISRNLTPKKEILVKFTLEKKFSISLSKNDKILLGKRKQ